MFLGYVLFGALIVMRWPGTWRVHAACAAWGLFIELTRFTCPLTTLEKWLRVRAGQPSYAGGFWEEYVVTQVLPNGLPRPVQTFLVVTTTALAIAAYVRTFRLRGAAVARLEVPLEAQAPRLPAA